MPSFKKTFFVCFFLLNNYWLYANNDSSNIITIHLDKQNVVHVELPEQKNDLFEEIAPLLPIIGFVGALLGIWLEIRTRRKDDRKRQQLERINRQISKFYMPLYALYEKGHKNYYSFVELFGVRQDFENPNFKDWAYSVFEPTNLGMLDIIINKADLIVGNEIPDNLLQFCHWAETFKAYLKAHQEKDFNNEKWRDILVRVPHPEIKMQAYLHAGVQILKSQQNNLLTGHINYIDETLLCESINKLTDQLIEKSKDPRTFENQFWAKLKEKNKGNSSVQKS